MYIILMNHFLFKQNPIIRFNYNDDNGSYTNDKNCSLFLQIEYENQFDQKNGVILGYFPFDISFRDHS